MTKENASVSEGEIVETHPAALSNPQAVMLTPSQLRKQMARDQEVRAIVTEYISNNMKAGVDYGTITIKGKDGRTHESKPSLFKPGAEKFCSLFKLRPTFRKDDETANMLGDTTGIIAYVCTLIDTRGRVVGEGRGTAKADISGYDFDINKQVKIAQKRAQTDAVLRTGGLSDFFTQDMEDAPRVGAGDNGGSTAAAPQASETKPASKNQLDFITKLRGERGIAATEPMPETSAAASQEIGDLLKTPKVSNNNDGGPY